jgi:hypothetical protein
LRIPAGQRGQRHLRLCLERVLRLVPGDRQGADPDRHRRPAARHPPHPDPHAGSHPAAGAPGHPVHHRRAVAEGRARWPACPALGQHRALPGSQPQKIDEAAIAHVASSRLAGGRLPQPARRDERVARHPAAAVRGGRPGTKPSCANGGVLQALAKLSEVRVFEDEAAWSAAAQAAPVAVVGEARLCLHMEIDVAAEKQRLGKEGNAAGGRNRQGPRKLSNEAFVAKAPPAVIEQERKRVADFAATLEKVRASCSAWLASRSGPAPPPISASSIDGALTKQSESLKRAALSASCTRWTTYQLARKRASRVCEPMRGVSTGFPDRAAAYRATQSRLRHRPACKPQCGRRSGPRPGPRGQTGRSG